MAYKLFLDDVRSVEMIYGPGSGPDFVLVRSYDAFVAQIQAHGLPEFISFDNDLGLDDSGQLALDGYAAAKWLVFQSGHDLRGLKFHVHSANPVAAQQIRGLLDNYLHFLAEEDAAGK